MDQGHRINGVHNARDFDAPRMRLIIWRAVRLFDQACDLAHSDKDLGYLLGLLEAMEDRLRRAGCGR